MEDSINLKKRILRMREANNTDNVIINPKTFNVKDSVPRKLIKENVFTNSNASINNISKNINIKSNTDNNFSSIKKYQKDQFNIITMRNLSCLQINLMKL